LFFQSFEYSACCRLDILAILQKLALLKHRFSNLERMIDAIDKVKMQVVKIERKLLLEALRKTKG
jgi:hypothetical protein